jgi:hypothetical protein
MSHPTATDYARAEQILAPHSGLIKVLTWRYS